MEYESTEYIYFCQPFNMPKQIDLNFLLPDGNENAQESEFLGAGKRKGKPTQSVQVKYNIMLAKYKDLSIWRSSDAPFYSAFPRHFAFSLPSRRRHRRCCVLLMCSTLFASILRFLEAI